MTYNLYDRFEFDEGIETYYSDNLTIEDKMYFEITSNIKDIYNRLKKCFYEKTGIKITTAPFFTDAEIALGPREEFKDEYKMLGDKFNDLRKNIWITGIQEISKINPKEIEFFIMNFEV